MKFDVDILPCLGVQPDDCCPFTSWQYHTVFVLWLTEGIWQWRWMYSPPLTYYWTSTYCFLVWRLKDPWVLPISYSLK
jgi:hypothetical protein